MRHEDFLSLDLNDAVGRLLGYCQTQTGAQVVHWISGYGLERVQDSSPQNWQWAFESADVIGQHVISYPSADLWGLYQMWHQVAQLYPRPWKPNLAPHAMPTAKPASFVLPLAWNGEVLGFILLESPTVPNPVQLMKAINPGIELSAKYVAFSYQHLRARNLSYEDELTGLYNQRYLPMVLEHEIERSRREGIAFSLLFLDIDYFKMVNDHRGHWVGSKLLVEMARVLKSQVRTCDYAFRYGGDEFIVVLGGSNAENSAKVAERIRGQIESHAFSVEGHELKLTVSIGLAAYPDHAQSAAGLIQLADQAMYYGKRKSRNIVFVAS